MYIFVTSLLTTPSLCESCKLAKSKRLSFSLDEKRALNVLDLIHYDLWGPAPIATSAGYCYYVIFVDDYSRFTWMYPLRLKSDFYAVLVSVSEFS